MVTTPLPDNIIDDTDQPTAHPLYHNTIAKLLAGPIWRNVQGHGAVGDGVTDATAAIQAAIDLGGHVRLPPGVYLCDAAKLDLDVADVCFEGAGAGATTLKITGATQVGLDVAADRVKIRNLTLLHATSTATAGAAIRLTSNGYCEIENVTLAGGWFRNIEVIDGFQANIRGCFLFDHKNAGLWHGQTTNGDRGDTIIEGCTIDTGSGGATNGVFWESGGGLRVLGNKILGHVNGVLVDIKPAITTQGVYVRGNSIENCTGYAVRAKRASGTPTLNMVEITDNQIDVSGDGISLESAGIGLSTVHGNNIRVPNTKTGINIGAAVVSTQVTGNQVNGALVGLAIAADAQVAARGNQFYNCATLISNLAGLDIDTGPVEQLYQFHLPANTSTTVYDALIQIDMDDYRTAFVEFTFDLILNGVGRASAVITKLLNKDAAGVTVTAVASVVAGSVFDVQFDTTTVSGSVQVGVRRNSGAGGTSILGQVHMRVLGHVKAVQGI